jgi:hypothetical protein
MARQLSWFPPSYIRSMILRKGLIRGNRAWLVVGSTLWAGRVLRRVVSRTGHVVAIEELRLGQVLRLEAIAAPTRSDRKRGKAVGQPEGRK